MSVKYRKVVNNRKGSKTQGKIYGRAVVSDTIYTKKLCQNIRDRCTLTEPDVVAVVSALVTEVTAQLALGNRVVLDGFGSFKVVSTLRLPTPPRSLPLPTSWACTSSSSRPSRCSRVSV